MFHLAEAFPSSRAGKPKAPQNPRPHVHGCWLVPTIPHVHRPSVGVMLHFVFYSSQDPSP